MKNLKTQNPFKLTRWLMVLLAMFMATSVTVWGQTYTISPTSWTTATATSTGSSYCSSNGSTYYEQNIRALAYENGNNIVFKWAKWDGSNVGTSQVNYSLDYSNEICDNYGRIAASNSPTPINGGEFNIAKSSIPNGTTSYRMYVEGFFQGTSYRYYSKIITITKTSTAVVCNVPTNLSSYNITSNSATFSWWSSNASNYDVEVSFNGGASWSSNTMPNTSVNLTNLAANSVYKWRVRANCNGTYSDWTSVQSFVTLGNPPSSPSLSAIPNGTNGINLSWTATGTSYDIYQNGNWINNTTSTSMGVVGLSAGTSYCYKVKAFNSAGSSDFSNNACTTTSMPTPSLSVNPSSVTLASALGSSGSSYVTSNISWNASSNASWLSVSPTSSSGNQYLSIQATSANTSTSSRTGTITVSGSGVSTQYITVTQQGVAATSVIALSIPTNGTNFGSVQVGQTAQRYLRISNSGNSTMSVSSISYPSGFSGAWSGTVAAGNYYDVLVTFSPSSATSYGGNITVNSSATSGSNTIYVQGTGIAAPSVSIDNTTSVIPPYQRQGDGFNGSVKANIVNGSGQTWYLQALKGSAVVWTSASYSSGASITFNSSNFGTLSSGDEISYKAVLSSGASSIATQKTKINPPMLNKETFVMVKGNNTDKIRIPFRYSTISSEKPSKVKIKNLYYDDKPIKYNATSVDFPLNSSTIESGGIFFISNANANIMATGASVFQYSFLNSAGQEIETGRFEIVLLGRTHAYNTSSSKVLVAIGGLWNDMNTDMGNLNNSLQSASSDKSFSIINYQKFSTVANFDSWFIQASNASYTQRNAHGIGLALERLMQEKSNNVTEINLITHSKGGLDTKALLANKACSYKNHTDIAWPPTNSDVNSTGNFKYNSASSIYSKIKKVLFLGTPHLGGMNILLRPIAFQIHDDVPAIKELILAPNHPILNTLSNYNYSNLGIKFANLTGWGLLFTQGNGDGIVPAWSSKSFYFYNPDVTTQLKIVQSSLVFSSDIYHLVLHKNKTLGTDEHSCATSSNLDRIYEFFTANSVASCSEFRSFITELNGSKVTNGKVYLKRGTSAYSLVNYSGINGFSSIVTGEVGANDSVKIEANGYETVRIPLSSLSLGAKINSIPLIPSLSTTNKIVKPDLRYCFATINDWL